MIRALLSRARDYIYKMQLQADIVGLELDLAMAKRQTVPMPELERTLNEEISLALAMIDNIDAKRQAKTTPMVPATDLHRATSRISQLEQHLQDSHGCLSSLATLVADDCHAATYQSLGQYRNAIKKFIAQGAK